MWIKYRPKTCIRKEAATCFVPGAPADRRELRRLAKEAWRRCRGLTRRDGGSTAVEFAILGSVFLLLVGGAMDLGHAWHMNNVMSNACREGVRYGTKYIPSGISRVLPKDLNPSIRNYILNDSSANGGKGGWGLATLLPPDAGVQVTLGGPAATATDPATLTGQDLTVTITARKTWFFLGMLLPGLGSYKTLSATTTMKCE